MLQFRRLAMMQKAIAEPIDTNDYLTFEALEDGFSVKFYPSKVQYCIDGDGKWMTMFPYSDSTTINKGQTISIKATLKVNSDYRSVGRFELNKKANVKGNIMSLVYGENREQDDIIPENGMFDSLFENNENLISAQNLLLPATELKTRCYDSMFYNCTSLTDAPLLLPASTLADYCYMGMYQDCNSLRTASEMAATTLASECCASMYQDCTSLTIAPKLPATNLANSCYSFMFNRTGLINAPALPATTLADYCYEGMFHYCKDLESAPVLVAKTMKPNCYDQMFDNCNKVAYIKMLAEEFVADSTTYWVRNVSPSGTFVKAAGVEIPTGTSGIPEGWTVEEVAV